MKLTRFTKNPIISPSSNWWETQATFNPAVTIYDNKVIMLYRAIGGDSLSRFGLAVSLNGEVFDRFADPKLEGDIKNPYERLGIEDPRITKIDDTYYIVYTAPSVYEASFYKKKDFAPSLSHPAPWRVRPSLITTKDFITFERKGILLDIDTKDATLFPEKINGKYVLLHRIYPHVYLSYSDDLVKWEAEKIIFSPREGFWDSERVGAGSVPIKTDYGWLIFYHGVDKNHVYRLGTAILNLEDPSQVMFRTDQPILEPEDDFEKVGLTPNVVFTCGAIEKAGEIFVYYGAADKYIGLAKIKKEEIFSEIKK